MNKIIVIVIKGEEYNRTLKWNSAEEFKTALVNGDGLPDSQDIVIDAYIDDNLIDLGNTFDVTARKLAMVLGIDY